MKTVLEFTREKLIKELEKERIRKNVNNKLLCCEYEIISQYELIHDIRKNKNFTEILIKSNIQELKEFYSCFLEHVFSENEMFFKESNKNNHDSILQHYILNIAGVLVRDCLEILGKLNSFGLKEYQNNEKEQILLNVLEMLKNDKRKVLNLEDEL